MGVNWTKEQQQVIELKNRNILVSAAAGSGKTAVLVERILKKMTRKENPVDIDRLLIVTFTRATAGEMRERLTDAVEKRLEEDPDNEHLQRQQTLIYNAQITTIDGFCSYIIRNYFHTIDLDPGYRIANEGELKLLRMDVAKELLEARYAEGSPEFHQFIEVFATGKSDENIAELILKLYDFAMSNPWPQEWLETCKEPYLVETEEELLNSRWMEKLWRDVELSLEQAEFYLEQSLELLQEIDGPYMYEDALRSDKMLLEHLQQVCRDRDFNGCCSLLQNHKFAVLSRKKDDAVSDGLRQQTKENRDLMKEILKEVKERYFYGDTEKILQEMKLCRQPVLQLLQLTEDFAECFAEKKKKRNIVDFPDIEHYALEILVKKENGELIYTDASEEFSQRFEEILIDEYQDSNLVQETLLQSVSRMRHGHNNIFMVGDVKQSIYRFRLARPELFMEKYDTYTLEDSLCQRIDLHRNFRSRKEVLAGVNYIFEQIMGKNLGDVEYDEAAALYPGAVFPEAEEHEEEMDAFRCTEVLLGETDTEELSDDQEEKTAIELEARIVGTRIKEIVGHEFVLDKASGTYRKARYQDCVILLRTISGWAETFVQVLMDMGIPAHASSRTGYFGTTEIVTILNYLHICDNPMQEIPFTGVLLSPIVGCQAEDLAEIKIFRPELKIYDSSRKYLEEGENEELKEKLESFFSVYDRIRDRVPYTPIHRLIQMILQETGYESYAAAMPGGIQRRANLQMLVEKAMEYEGTSYRGLFNFIRYTEQLRKYEVDFGEISTIGENEDTVRILSIHKSKGLEFPVVFVSGMGKRFNMMDANAGLVIHPDLGVAMQGIDPKLRLKVPTLMRQVIQKQIRVESLGEELRVLYVALTRAKEKLILTGTTSKLEKKLIKYRGLLSYEPSKLPYGMLESAQDYWGWVLPALARHPAFQELYEMYDLTGAESVQEWCELQNQELQEKILFQIRLVEAAALTGEELRRQITLEQRYEEYMNWDTDKMYDAAVKNELEERFSYRYPNADLQEIPAKVSVSELKKEYALMPDEEAETMITEVKISHVEAETLDEAILSETPEEQPIPAFMKTEKEEVKGVARGTAYHKVMEELDYDNVDSEEAVRQQMLSLEHSGKLDHEAAASVRVNQIAWFASSRLGKRMQAAWKRKKLWREQPFVMSVPACEHHPEWGNTEQILVQGIIDAFFEEDRGLVLVDYKTDYVEKGEEEKLINRYQKQLWYYARALERVRNLPVKEAYIYSFRLGKALRVPVHIKM